MSYEEARLGQVEYTKTYSRGTSTSIYLPLMHYKSTTRYRDTVLRVHVEGKDEERT